MTARPHRRAALAAVLAALAVPAAAGAADPGALQIAQTEAPSETTPTTIAPPPAPTPEPDPAAPAPAPGGGATPNPGGTAAPAPEASDGAIVDATRTRARETDPGPPAPLVALAVVGALLLLGVLVAGVLRALAVQPRWAVASRHAIAEAGWRTSGAWSDFADWVRRRRPAA